MSTNELLPAADLPPDTLVLIRAEELARIKELCSKHGLLEELRGLDVLTRSTNLMATRGSFLGEAGVSLRQVTWGA